MKDCHDNALVTGISNILKENERRKSALNSVFDPITGEGSLGERVQLSLHDFIIPQQWVPVEMLSEPLCRILIERKSILSASTYLSDRKEIAVKCGFSSILPSFEAVSTALLHIRAKYDFPFWAAKYAYIKRKGGGDDTLFHLNRPQRMFVDRLEAARRDNRPIRLILLKARQWGGSTCSQLYMAWLQLMHCRGLNSLIIAHQGSGSDEIKDMFDRMIAAYPDDLLHYDSYGEASLKQGKKMENVGKSRSIFRVPARNCKIKIGSAERPDSCRGGDYNLVHCSEVGIWKATDGKTPESIVRSACSGVLLQPMTMIVYESTANGTGNFFQREYEAAKRGESQFEPFFISWFDIDQYSLPVTDPEGFARILYEGRHSEGVVSSRRQPGKYLWWLWEKGATLEAINWFIEERAKFDSHGIMASEYPSDDVEAFVHSGSRVFDIYAVERMRRNCRAPLFTGEVAGIGDSGAGAISDVRFVPAENGGLKIWNMPEIDSLEPVGNRYLVVVDVGGRSHKSDWSVIAVFDRIFMSDGEGPSIVAQWRGHTDFDILSWKAASIAAFYDNALLVIESNSIETRDAARISDSDNTPYIFAQLRSVYPNLYRRKAPVDSSSDRVTHRYGFHTNTATKPMVIAALNRAIRDSLYIERDADAITEYLTYEQRQNGSYGAIPGAHDDILMTRAIGIYISTHEMPLPTFRQDTPVTSHHRGPATEAEI